MKYTLLFMASLAFALQAHAQSKLPNDTTLNRTVVVEQEYTPDIMDANKVNVLPRVTPPAATHPEVRYDEKMRPAGSIPVSTMQPYGNKAVSLRPLPGLLRLGYGNAGRLDALAAYRFMFSAHDELDLSLGIQGHKDLLDLPDFTEQWNSRYYHTEAHADYLHRFSQAELNMGANFGLSNFSLLPRAYADKQKFTSGGVHLGVNSAEESRHALHYRSDVALRYYQRQNDINLNNMSEATIQLQGEVWGNLDERQAVGIGIQVNQYLYKNSTYDNHTAVTLNPTYRFRNDSWNLRAGISSDLAFSFGKKWQIAPDVEIDYITGSHVLYAHAKGGRLDNDFRRIERLNPYAQLGQVQFDATYEQINACLGWKASPLPDFHIHLYGGYQRLKNDLMAAIIQWDGATDYSLSSALWAGDTENFYAGLSTGYNYRKLFGFHLSTLYRNWQEDEWFVQDGFKPKLEVEASVETSPIEQLSLCLGYRHISYTASMYEEHSDLYLRGVYHLHTVWRGLDIWVEGHNLLNQSYTSYPVVPALGFHLMGGVNLRF